MATNQQRREAAKRKLERQLARRAERAKRRRIIGIGVTIGAVVVVAGLVVILSTQGGGDPNAAAGEAGSNSPAPSSQQPDIPTERVAAPERPTPLPDPTTCEYPKSGDAAKPVDPPSGSDVPSRGTVEVTLRTSQGDIPLTLDRSLAPCTVNSFVSLAEQGFYTDTSCHRISTTGLQMLQCGDPTGSGSGGPGYTFADELFKGLTYGRGILAMANSGPDTNGSQFFMVYGNAPLDPNYTVFGTISDAGLKVIDKVARGGHDGRFESSAGGGKPNVDVKFTGVTVQGA
ncbi:peptidylprolyl isomerase [Prauserella muralis]|uniref:Peptidyl-prolyl cis-trans isomerase n=1 Tax=Prauserella muralis TaxID=588067 RepID=A0A2V4AUL5_9PSEU|nr:peptidylprolyl isomerase [Prauserella muralis]PXY19227.1 peptidylprolyl isomerase [Prauserella muralis]TWE29154.1 peptidyl-prolyl cis-trans isomerase B (cyclophilin B) [Prauserella muralis]